MPPKGLEPCRGFRRGLQRNPSVVVLPELLFSEIDRERISSFEWHVSGDEQTQPEQSTLCKSERLNEGLVAIVCYRNTLFWRQVPPQKV